MTDQNANRSPQLYARIAGVLYLINIGCGLFGEAFVRARLTVAGDAAATAHNIVASEFLFRLGIAGDLVMHITDVPMTLIFYILLRPVSRNLSLLAALFGMLQTAILCANKLNLIAVLLLLEKTSYTRDFSQGQIQGLVSLCLEQHELGFGVGLIFFGVSCLVTGYLMFRSGYFPKAIGVLQAIAGVCYLVNSFALLLAPPLANRIFPAIVLPSFIGELATCVWLMVWGIRVRLWPKQVTVSS